MWHLTGCCQLGNKGWVMDSAHKYFAQVQGQLGVTKIEECDFVIYTTKGIHSIPIKFDKLYYKIMEANLK